MTSINHGVFPVRKWLQSMLTKVESLLSPAKLICVACNGAYTTPWELPLCRKCADAIPWILQVCCDICGRPEKCPDCVRRKDASFERNRSAVSYNSQMKAWLGIYKYRGHEKMRQLLGSMLLHAYHLHKHSQSAESMEEARDHIECITYVPLSERRLHERGFNQSQQLAEELGRSTGLPVIPLLYRTRHTDKQSFKTRGDRLADLRDVFALLPSAKNKYRALLTGKKVTIYVVDDVYTTGSTLNETAKAIKNELDSADICGISWAR